MANPTKVAQNVWTTEAHRDFLQLIEENSGRIFSWIDYQGFLQGNFLTGSGGGGGAGIGGVQQLTTNYTANSGDAGTLLVFNSPTVVTLSLPANAPNKWTAFFLNIGPGPLVVSPNGNLLNGFSSSFTFSSNQGGIVFSDNTNYFLVQCGALTGGGSGTDFSLPFPLVGTADGVNTTFLLPTAPTGTIAITVGGLVQEEGVDFVTAGLTVAFNPLSAPTQTPIAYFGTSGGGGGGGTDVVAAVNLTAQTASIATSLLYATSPFAAGIYRVSVDLICTTAGAAGGVSIAIGWNNGVTLAGLISGSPMSLSTPGESSSLSGTFYSAVSQNITYATTVTGGVGSAYALRIRLEYLG
jgi:hypothetical protein